VTRGRALLLAALLCAVVVADQLSKSVVRATYAVGEYIPVIDGALWLTHIFNTGASFGVLRGQGWFFIATAVVVLVAIAWMFVRVRPQALFAQLGLALVAGGSVGNLIDRIAAGGVTDFIDVGWWPVFNVADIALNVGVALVVVWIVFAPPHPERAAAGGPPRTGHTASGDGLRHEAADGDVS
jgi:signal peptidase II